MKKFIIFAAFISLLSFRKETNSQDRKVFDRINFIFYYKKILDEKSWPTFNNINYNVPLIYYADTNCYVANPTNKFIEIFKPKLIYQNNKFKFYKTKQRIDSLPFHLETSITFGDTSNEYDFRSPFMKCSSFEEVSKKIPGVLSTERWATMVIHEYFHGYQFKHEEFFKYFENNIITLQEDSLRKIYKNNEWFKNSLDKENILLLKALSEPDISQTKKLLDTFFVLRQKRRVDTKNKIGVEINKFEKCYETMEGTARFMEYSLYNAFATEKRLYPLIESDTSFKSFAEFRNYDIEKDPWLFMTNKTTYFYATGFNMVRLLNKMKIEYKSKLFNQGNLTLEDILFVETMYGR